MGLLPKKKEVAGALSEVAKESGVEGELLARRAAVALEPWLRRASERTWKEAPTEIALRIDASGLHIGEPNDPPYVDTSWSIAVTFAATSLDENDPARKLLRRIGFRQDDHEEGSLGAWLAGGGADGVEVRHDQLALRLERVVPTTWRAPVEGDEVYVFGEVRRSTESGDRVEHFLDRVPSTGHALLCPVATDARDRLEAALTTALARLSRDELLSSDEDLLAATTVHELVGAFRDAPRAPLPERSWVDVVEQDLLAPLLVDKPTWSLPHEEQSFVELLHVVDGDLDAVIYVDRLEVDRGVELGALKPLFRLVQHDPKTKKIVNILEQQSYFYVLRLADFHRTDTSKLDPAWLPLIRERWLETLKASLLRHFREHGSMPMPTDFITGEPVRACLICLEEGGPPELERPVPSFDPGSQKARSSAERLRVATDGEVDALGVDGVVRAVVTEPWTLAIVPGGMKPGVYLARAESCVPIVVDWGPDGFLCCDGDEPTCRAVITWLSAALDAHDLHAEWEDEWGDSTSSREWLRFLERERTDEPVDWRGTPGMVVDWPFTPEPEAKRASLLYYDFIRSKLAPDWAPST